MIILLVPLQLEKGEHVIEIIKRSTGYGVSMTNPSVNYVSTKSFTNYVITPTTDYVIKSVKPSTDYVIILLIVSNHL